MEPVKFEPPVKKVGSGGTTRVRKNSFKGDSEYCKLTSVDENNPNQRPILLDSSKVPDTCKGEGVHKNRGRERTMKKKENVSLTKENKRKKPKFRKGIPPVVLNHLHTMSDNSKKSGLFSPKAADRNEPMTRESVSESCEGTIRNQGRVTKRNKHESLIYPTCFSLSPESPHRTNDLSSEKLISTGSSNMSLLDSPLQNPSIPFSNSKNDFVGSHPSEQLVRQATSSPIGNPNCTLQRSTRFVLPSLFFSPNDESTSKGTVDCLSEKYTLSQFSTKFPHSGSLDSFSTFPSVELPRGGNVSTSPTAPSFSKTDDAKERRYCGPENGDIRCPVLNSTTSSQPTSIFPVHFTVPTNASTKIPANDSGDEFQSKRLLLKSIDELYDTEVSYLNVLSLMVEYGTIFEKEGVPSHHISILLGNVVELHDVSAKLLLGFYLWRKGAIMTLFTVFKSVSSQFLTAMIAYCDHYKSDHMTVRNILFAETTGYKKTREIIITLLKQKNHPQSEFISWLIQPIQRVMRYKMILEEIKKNIPPSNHAMKTDIEASIGITGQIADRVNEYQTRLAMQKESHLLAKEFSLKFENGNEFITEIENEFATKTFYEAEVRVLEPCTEVAVGPFSNWKYPRRSATPDGKRMTYVLATGAEDHCVLSEKNCFLLLHGDSLIRATTHKKVLMIEDVVSLMYGFYHKGSGEDRKNDLQIITPNHNFIMSFKTNWELEEWIQKLNELFKKLNDVPRIRQKRRRLSRRVVHYVFSSYILGIKRYRKSLCLYFIDLMSDDVAGTKFFDGCGYGLVGQSGETDEEKAKYQAQSVQRKKRKNPQKKSDPSIVGETPILALDDGYEDNEKCAFPSPLVAGSCLASKCTQEKKGLNRTAGGQSNIEFSQEDPAVKAMYNQLHQLSDKKEVLKDKYEKNVSMIRANIVKRKRLLLEHGEKNVNFTKDELLWEIDEMLRDRDGSISRLTPRKSCFQKLFSPKPQSKRRSKMK